MEDQNEHRDRSGEGNAWTSYSDLFMAVAILFLILFVFAMFTTGLNQVKTAVEKRENLEYQLGKVPDAIREKNKSDMASIKESASTLEEKREILRKSLEELSGLNDSLKEREDSLNRLYEDQMEKQAMLAVSQEEIKNRDSQIQELKKKLEQSQVAIEAQAIESQREAVASTSELEKTRQTLEQSEAKAETAQSQLIAKVQGLEAAVASEKAELKSVQALLSGSKQAQSLQAKIEQNLQAELEKMQNEKKNLSGTLALKTEESASLKEKLKEEKEAYSKQSQEVRALEKGNSELNKESKAQSAKIAQLSQEISDLKDALGKAQKNQAAQGQEIAEMGAQKQKLEKQLEGEKGDKEELKSRLAKLDGELGEAKGRSDSLEKDLKSLAGDKKKLEGQLAKQDQALAEQVGRLDKQAERSKDLASQMSELKKESQTKDHIQKALNDRLEDTRKQLVGINEERKNIAGDIVKKLQKKDASIEVDKETGIITLRMDESFFFKNNSYELTESAKAKMKEIIPVYAESLLGNKITAHRISAITITGFASPRFKGAFVDPTLIIPEAYTYNLSLSFNRARELTEFIFGDEIGDYNFKTELQAITSASGKSYVDSKLAQKDSKVEANCGKFDCAQSRRVEINFVLKDRKQVDDRFQNVTNDLMAH